MIPCLSCALSDSLSFDHSALNSPAFMSKYFMTSVTVLVLSGDLDDSDIVIAVGAVYVDFARLRARSDLIDQDHGLAVSDDVTDGKVTSRDYHDSHSEASGVPSPVSRAS